MNKKTNPHYFRLPVPVAGVAAFYGVFAAWVLWANFMIWLDMPFEKSKLGEDGFAGINALFSGLAFAGVVLALYFQKIELGLQREQLKIQQEEMKQNTAELKGQKEILKQQYELLRDQQEIEATLNLVNVVFYPDSGQGAAITVDVAVINNRPTPLYVGQVFANLDGHRSVSLITTNCHFPIEHGDSCIFSGKLPLGYLVRSINCGGKNGILWRAKPAYLKALNDGLGKAKMGDTSLMRNSYTFVREGEEIFLVLTPEEPQRL